MNHRDMINNIEQFSTEEVISFQQFRGEDLKQLHNCNLHDLQNHRTVPSHAMAPAHSPAHMPFIGGKVEAHLLFYQLSFN